MTNQSTEHQTKLACPPPIPMMVSKSIRSKQPRIWQGQKTSSSSQTLITCSTKRRRKNDQASTRWEYTYIDLHKRKPLWERRARNETRYLDETKTRSLCMTGEEEEVNGAASIRQITQNHQPKQNCFFAFEFLLRESGLLFCKFYVSASLVAESTSSKRAKAA